MNMDMNLPAMETFGNRLRNLRLQRNLSQEKLACELYVTPQAVSKWENGKTLPDLVTVVSLSKVLHITTDELLGNNRPWEEWEREWQKAVVEGRLLEAKKIADAAMRDLPGKKHFYYRAAISDFLIAQGVDDLDKRMDLLLEAENKLRTVLHEYPDFREAAAYLIKVLACQGRLREAEKLARRHPDSQNLLLELLEGPELEEQKQRVATARAIHFLSFLVEEVGQTAYDLAECFVREFPWVHSDRVSLLAWISCRQAISYCEKGYNKEAITCLQKVKELLFHCSIYEMKETESFSFLRTLPDLTEGEGGLLFYTLLDPRLRPLEGNPDYQQLLTFLKRSEAGQQE